MSHDVTLTTPPDATRTGAGSAPLPPASPLDAPPGYTLDREIGSGGMGVVYLARQSGLNRVVALKTVRSGTTLDPRALIRFLAEAEAIASVRHPSVVEVYSFGEHAGRPYLALEYCPGGDLTTLSKAEQTRDANWFRKVAELMAKIADGVNAAHAQGIVHRDLKPANVLLTADGTPKVTDFGLAKRGLGSDLTQTQDVLGTPAYMAPEQASGRTKFVGPEADVWALGVMLYELLCGARPFDGSNPLEVMAAVAKADVPKLHHRFPAVPRDLALVTHKCLSADPRDRYPTAGALATDLRNWLDGKPVSARPAGVIESAVKWVQRNKRAALTGAGVLLTMATATAVSFGFGIDANEQRTQARADAKRAEEEKQAAIEAKNELAKANEKTERALARAFLDKLELIGSIGWTDYNFESAHWDLAENAGSPFGWYVLEEATRRMPAYGARGGILRHELAHAIVGLNRDRRSRFEKMLDERMADRQIAAVVKVRLAALARDGYGTVSAASFADCVLTVWASTDQVQQADLLEDLLACVVMVPERSEDVLALTLHAIDQQSTAIDNSALCEITSKACEHLPQKRAHEIGSNLARKLFDRVSVYTGPFESFSQTRGLKGLLRWLPPDEARNVRRRVVSVLRERCLKAEDGYLQSVLGQAIGDMLDVASDESDSAVAAEIATRVTSSFRPDASVVVISWQTSSLQELITHLPPRDQANIATKTLEYVRDGMKKYQDHEERETLAAALVSASKWIEASQAEQILTNALEKATGPREKNVLAQQLARLGTKPKDQEQTVRRAFQIADDRFYDSPSWYSPYEDQSPICLEALCLGLSREELHRSKALPALAGGMVSPESQPKPNPLPPQVLVDLLKRPFVVREKRRAVLNALEVTYDRKFKDLWEFVAFAETEHPELDLLTPPKRPERN